MRYTVKKLGRDLLVAAAGSALLYVAGIPFEALPDVGAGNAYLPLVPVVANFLYRELRERNDALYDLDEPGS